MSFFISDALAQNAPQQQGGGFELLIMVLIFFGIMYFMIIRPQSKRAKEHKKMVEALSKGDEVVTNEIGDNFIQVEIAEGTEVKVQRQAISAIMPKGTSKNL